MKKKDLVPGTIYSPRNAAPYLLLSTGIWRTPRTFNGSPSQYFLLREGSKPARGHGYSDFGQGVLALGGSHQVMRTLQKNHAPLIAAIAALVPGDETVEHTEPVRELLVQARVQDLEGGAVYIRLENYQRWAGTYDEVRDAEAAQSRRLRNAFDELARMRILGSERASALQDRVSAVLEERLALGHATHRVVSTNGEHSSYVTSGLELGFERLERLLELAEKGKAAEAGLTDPAGDFITE